VSNPFRAINFTNISTEITQDAVHKCLAVEEAAQMAAGTAYVLHEEISASLLIMMGLDFEEQQCMDPSSSHHQSF
jgi:uncharacterized protein YfiM (DUF2279 family)